jgi:hypothetical protein
LAQGPFSDAPNKGIDDIEIDIGFEQGRADFAQAIANVGFAQPAATTELLERITQPALNAVEHRQTRQKCRIRRCARHQLIVIGQTNGSC